MTDKTIDIKLTETKSGGSGWIIAVLSLIILAGVFFWGYKTYPKYNPCPVIERDTTYIYDTVTYTITKDHYHQKLDTIIKSDTVLTEVDTAEILNLYFSTYQYTRTFEDTLIKAVLEDRVTQNKPAVISFDYTIKRPQTVIQNISNQTTYNKYLLFGLNVPFKDMKYGTVEFTFVAPKWYVGAGFMPNLQSMTVKAGINILKIK